MPKNPEAFRHILDDKLPELSANKVAVLCFLVQRDEPVIQITNMKNDARFNDRILLLLEQVRNEIRGRSRPAYKSHKVRRGRLF